MIKSNFKLKEIELSVDELKMFEDIVAKSGKGSHMVFRSTSSEDDELFVDEL